MTTGNFTLQLVEFITVERESRQRRDLVGIDELAESISRNGLIHPILIDRDYKLVAGERRLSAAKQLGWSQIQCQFTDEADPAALQELELEENIRRHDISWQDQCAAVERYHLLRKQDDPEWSQTQTAMALNISQPQVVARIQVAEALRAQHPRVLAAPKYSVARGIVERDRERRVAAQMRAVTARPVSPAPDIPGTDPEPPTAPASPIITADFRTWQHEGPEPFNFVHCDLPYGIGAGTFDQGSSWAHGTFDDSFDNYKMLLNRLHEYCAQGWIAESAHLMFWFSMKHYNYTHTKLIQMGWWVDEVPLTWQKSDNTGVLSDVRRRPRYITEFCFYGSRGDRKIVESVANGISAPTEQAGHMSVKPQRVLRHFMRMFVDDTTNGLDPTCGSGGAVKAIRGLGGTATGLEINPEFADIARSNVDGH